MKAPSRSRPQIHRFASASGSKHEAVLNGCLEWLAGRAWQTMKPCARPSRRARQRETHRRELAFAEFLNSITLLASLVLCWWFETRQTLRQTFLGFTSHASGIFFLQIWLSDQVARNRVREFGMEIKQLILRCWGEVCPMSYVWSFDVDEEAELMRIEDGVLCCATPPTFGTPDLWLKHIISLWFCLIFLQYWIWCFQKQRE